jgi:hypothetical protein
MRGYPDEIGIWQIAYDVNAIEMVQSENWFIPSEVGDTARVDFFNE